MRLLSAGRLLLGRRRHLGSDHRPGHLSRQNEKTGSGEEDDERLRERDEERRAGNYKNFEPRLAPTECRAGKFPTL